jgi:formylglycine-generating enzyme required for sulfatase activity
MSGRTFDLVLSQGVSVIFGPLSMAAYNVNGVSFDMVCLPPGRFVDGEGPTRRELLVSRPFELGLTPVTQALWRAVTGLSPANFKGEDRPVENVSYDDVQAFLARLPPLGLTGFRLPTEAEWVWAARCGAPTRWAGADRSKPVAVAAARQTGLVAGLNPGPVGISDQSGNVYEWAGDWHERLPLAGFDLQGPASGSYRVFRGGSWSFVPRYARVAARRHDHPGSRSFILGVRLLRTAG